MAIRQVGNVIIIDSVGLLSTQPATGRSGYDILAVGLYSVNSTAAVNIALAANTTNIIFPLAGSLSNVPNFSIFQLGKVQVDELQVITVTAGTAYLYLA